jgi:hypothetical protein
MSPSHGPDGVGGRLPQGGASPQVEGEVRSAESELLLVFGSGSSEDGDAPPRGKARPPLDDAAPDSGLSRSPVAADGGGLRHRGPDGRLTPRIRYLVRGSSPQREVGQHRHSETYQCQVSSILV